MGRKKIDTNCKLPEGKINSTFMKRKRGAVNKAKQLGKLCDVDVVLIAFHPRNDAVIAVSHGGRVDEIIDKYHNFKQQHLEKVHFCEELRMQPQQLQPQPSQEQQSQPQQSQLQPSQAHQMPTTDQMHTNQMHMNQMYTNTQVSSHLPPPTFEQQMGVGMHMSQLEGFDIQAQGINGNVIGQPQGQLLLRLPTLLPEDFQHNNYGQ